MTDADWRRMAETSSIATEKGYRLAYDPGIAQNFRRYWLLINANLWRYWDRITCPVLILRGTEPDFLTPCSIGWPAGCRMPKSSSSTASVTPRP